MKQTDSRRELQKLQENAEVTNKRSDVPNGTYESINKTKQIESESLADFREQKGETIVQNNVMEPCVERFPHRVTEDSSSTSSSTTTEDVED